MLNPPTICICENYLIIKIFNQNNKLILCSSITTPSVDVAENEFNSHFRRSSTGVLLSPEVDVTSTSKIAPGEMSESDGIWILKKDSQRRQTLFKVLNEDEKKICDIWMEKIENERNEKTVLEMVKNIFKKTNEY